MAKTYEPIQSYTLASKTNTISFTSIPTTYTDLRLVFVGKSDPDASADYIALRFNGDTGSNYSSTVLRGNGSSASSTRLSNENLIFVGYTTLSQTYPELHLMDFYSYGSSSYKICFTSSSKDANGSGWVTDMVNLWRSGDAIGTITLTTPNVGNKFDIGTTATLYGIKNA
jgi:hypothetical protein